MSKKIRVAVIFGGRSAEHEVSLVSATSIISALDPQKYEVIPIGITREGRWICHLRALEMLKTSQIPPKLMALLQPDPTDKQKLVPQRVDDATSVSQMSSQFDVIFPVLHGTHGEDGSVQGLLELMSVPYVGAGVLGSSVGMDKVVQKHLFRSAGLPIVRFLSYTASFDPVKNEAELDHIEAELGYPIFVKPANLGSSIGINRVHNREELKDSIAEAFTYDRKVILEEGVENAREIEISVLGNEMPRASLPGEIIPDGEFYDYRAKYVSDESKLEIPAKLPADLVSRIQDIAVRAFSLTGCEGMARADFLLSGDNLYLSELNTIPGFTSISMYPKLWEASGLPYPQLLDELIRLAIERHEQKNKLKMKIKLDSDWYKK
jgi:D-alanine-D-alanine ligase